MLQVQELSGGYNGQAIFDHVSFTIRKGGILNILGKNGAGKSTLLKTILNFLKPYHGEVLIDNTNIKRLSVKEMAKLIAYVPQNHVSTFPFLVKDVILMGRTPYLNGFSSPKKADRLKTESIMDELEIRHLENKIYTEISGGERQLCLIARAMCQEAKILAMDEPVANLDFGNQIKIIKTIKQLSQKDITVIMISHFPNHALLCSETTGIMEEHQFSIGKTEAMITAEKMSRLYGIDVVIKKDIQKGKPINYCLPLI